MGWEIHVVWTRGDATATQRNLRHELSLAHSYGCVITLSELSLKRFGPIPISLIKPNTEVVTPSGVYKSIYSIER